MMELNGSRAGRREWFLAGSVALFAVGLTLMPYALGYAFARPGTQYMGLVINPEDSQSYFAKMLEGYEGHWLYTIPFTMQDHAPAFLGGFYIVLGQLARISNISLTEMWHLSRVLAAVAMFLLTFGFAASFSSKPLQRWTGYLLAVFGSGLGWVLLILNQPYWLGILPVDFKMPESHPFFTALTFPHVAIGTALILSSFWVTLHALDLEPSLQASALANAARSQWGDLKSWVMAAAAGLANIALAIVYPFLIYLVVLTVGLYWVYLCVVSKRVEWVRGLRIGLSLLIPLPLVLYYAITLATNPIFRAWDAQSITPSPPVPHYLIAYGLLLLLAALSLRKPVGARRAFLWAWLVACGILVYAPINPQRRFVEGVQIPLAILASDGLFDVVFPWIERTSFFRHLAARPRYSVPGLERLAAVAFIVFVSISNIYVLVRTSITTGVEQPYPLFRSTAEVEAANWLGSQTPHSAVVLSAYETGNYVASWAGNRVVLGHWAETVDFQARYDEVDRFYSAKTDDAWRSQMLSQYRADYVIEGPRERELGGWDPSRAPFLSRAFNNSQVTIYRVLHD